MDYNYVYWGVDPTTTVEGENGTPITPVSATNFAGNNLGYSLESTDPNCGCESETWLVFKTSIPGTYTITTPGGIITGAIYGPIPPIRPK